MDGCQFHPNIPPGFRVGEGYDCIRYPLRAHGTYQSVGAIVYAVMSYGKVCRYDGAIKDFRFTNRYAVALAPRWLDIDIAMAEVGIWIGLGSFEGDGGFKERLRMDFISSVLIGPSPIIVQ